MNDYVIWSRLRLPLWTLIVVMGLSISIGTAAAESADSTGTGIWQDVTTGEVVASAAASPSIDVVDYRLVSADMSTLDSVLVQAPQEGSGSGAELSVPLPDGSFQRFLIQEYSMMEADLAASAPGVTTYLGTGIDDPAASIRLSRTSSGFHGMILSPDGIQFIDPFVDGGDLYISYDERNLVGEQWSEELVPVDAALQRLQTAGIDSLDALNVGETLHSYRLAVAATGEFTQRYGSKQATKEGIVTIINRLNALFERDTAVRFVLIDNDAIIYTNGATDPYSTPVDFTAIGRMLNENQANLDAVVGTANYDVGHVFGIGGGGIGGTGPCIEGRKAIGSSNTGNPADPGFVTGLLAHEVAHMFSSGHSFNGACSAGGNPTRDGANAVEPGSGSTIMSYAGVCAPQNIVTSGDDYFHANSIREITEYVSNAATGGSCGTHIATGNAVPQVTGGADRIIPARTPFQLAGSATDGNGDNLAYTWEQMDIGTAWTLDSVLPNTDLGNNAIFRSYPPGPSATRAFPSPTHAGAAIGESLPTTARTMNFRLSARDGKGGIGSDDVRVSVVTGAGPFAITAPIAGAFWGPNTQQTVTWSVANTNQAPISCANVNILASTDGGANFFTVKANTPNDGSEQVTAPSASANLLVKIECTNATTPFYAISAKPGVRVCTPILQDNHEDGVAGWTVGGPTNPPGTYVPWALRTNGGFSGSNYWFVQGPENLSYTTLESLPLVATSDNTTMSFVHKYRFFQNTNQIGKAQVKVGAGDWQDLAGYTGSQDNYTETQLDLSTRVKNGDTFQIRFRRENNSNSWSLADTNLGWYVDDVLVCGGGGTPPVNPPPAATGETTWTGAVSTDWAEAGNWTNNSVPNAQTDAKIPTGTPRSPVIAADASVRNMLIETGAKVDMTGGNLTVSGNWGRVQQGGTPIEVCRAFGNAEGTAGAQQAIGTATVQDTINIETGAKITDLDLLLDVAHEWVSDVVVNLKHDGGADVKVFETDSHNCSGDNFVMTLDDEAPSSMTDTCTNTNPAFAGNRYRPKSALSAFDNQLSAGMWTLTVSDRYPTEDNGLLNRWCLNITTESTGGVFNGTGGKVIFAGAAEQSIRAGGASVFNDVQIGDNGTAQQVKFETKIDINGDLLIEGGAVLQAGGSTINLAGNWTQNARASFAPGTSSVVLDGGAQTLASGNAESIDFAKLTVNAGSTANFGGSDPQVAQTLVNNGTLRLTRALAAGNTYRLLQSGGYGGLTITPGAQALGNTTIAIAKNTQGCTALAGETVQRCFDINPQFKTGRTATLQFFYAADEQSGNSCEFMNGYQNDNSGTELPELPVQNRACQGPLRSITNSGVTDFTVTAFTLGADVGGPGKRADDPPVAVADTTVTEVDAEVLVDVLLNDYDPEGEVITLDFVGSAEHGEVSMTERGRVRYKPEAGFSGVDTFTYEISDVGEQSGTADVTVIVNEPTTEQNNLYLPTIRR